MAINKGGNLSGLVGPVVTYVVGNKNFIRGRAADIKQSRATKESAKHFGKIKAISSCLRAGLQKVLPGYRSKPVMFAMDAAVRKWYLENYLKQGPVEDCDLYFRNLNLNKEELKVADLLLGAHPEVHFENNRFRLSLPALIKENMQLPKYAHAISLGFVVSGYSFDNPSQSPGHTSEPVERQLTASMEPINIETKELTIEKNTLILCFLALRYKNNKKWMEEKSWNPVVVVKGFFI